jgi:hypothetical protein
MCPLGTSDSRVGVPGMIPAEFLVHIHPRTAPTGGTPRLVVLRFLRSSQAVLLSGFPSTETFEDGGLKIGKLNKPWTRLYFMSAYSPAAKAL